MQFFSLTPITLDLAASDREQRRRRADSVVVDERDESETARMEQLVQKMALHFPRRQGQPTQGAEVLPASINQVYRPCQVILIFRSIVHGNYPSYFSVTISKSIHSLGNVHSAYPTEFANKLPISATTSSLNLVSH